MDKDILKLLPQKAFKLLSVKDTFKIGTMVTRSVFDSAGYEASISSRLASWKFADIKLTNSFSGPVSKITSKEDGERILKVYFSQFFNKDLAVHLDLRRAAFSSGNESFKWIPSRLHYKFTPDFNMGVCSLYEGFYFDRADKFENGLKLLGIINDSMTEIQKENVKDLFYKHFGEGKAGAVRFSLSKIHESFNAIFSHFLKEDIILNPEFAVLGVNIVTLYLTLQDIPHDLNVGDAFKDVFHKYNLNPSG